MRSRFGRRFRDAHRYLLGEYVNGQEEETPLALLSIGYLALGCFGAEQSHRKNSRNAYNAFRVYAVAQWIGHLKSSSNVAPGLNSEHDSLVTAAQVHFAERRRDSFKPSSQTPKIQTAFRALAGSAVHAQVVQILNIQEGGTSVAVAE